MQFKNIINYMSDFLQPRKMAGERIRHAKKCVERLLNGDK